MDELHLPVDLAMTKYEAWRREARQESPQARVGAIGDAQFRMFHEYTAPYRVLRLEAPQPGERPYYIVLLVSGHGLEEEVWHLRGDHRERDAMRLSIVMRNQWLAAQRSTPGIERLDSFLRSCAPNVRALRGEGGQHTGQGREA